MQIKHLASCSRLLQNQSIAGRLCGSKILHLTRNHVCANISPPVPDANGRFDGLVVSENNYGDDSLQFLASSIHIKTGHWKEQL